MCGTQSLKQLHVTASRLNDILVTWIILDPVLKQNNIILCKYDLLHTHTHVQSCNKYSMLEFTTKEFDFK